MMKEVVLTTVEASFSGSLMSFRKINLPHDPFDLRKKLIHTRPHNVTSLKPS